jgi:hypothetical protein
MGTRNGRRKVLFGTHYPMTFHEPALVALDASRSMKRPVRSRSANAQLPLEGGPRRLRCMGDPEQAGGGSVPATDERRQRAKPAE